MTSASTIGGGEHLLRELAPQVLGGVIRRVRDFAAAEDAVQEALLAAAMQWPREGVPDNPRAWLIQVASRRMTDHVRSESARRRRETAAAAEIDRLIPTHEVVPHDEQVERHDLQFFTSYWFSWTLGAWIADAKARSTPEARSSVWLYVLAAAFIALGCAAFHFGQYGAFQLWAVGFAFYLYKALERPNADKADTPGVRLLSRFGDFSFSLYLIHLPIFVLLSSILFRSSLQMSIWPSFGYMLVAVPVAYVFYRLVELPAMKWSASFKPKNVVKPA